MSTEIEVIPQKDPWSLEPDTHPWHRLPRETDTAWAYFIAYRDMAYTKGLDVFEPRSVSKLAEAFGVTYKAIHNYHKAFSWERRVAWYDKYVMDTIVEASLSEAAQVKKEQLRVLGKISQVIDLEIAKLVEKSLQPESSLTPKELHALMQWHHQQRRLLAGEVTDRVAVQGELNLEKLSIEELEALEQMRLKSGGR
jgi:hypothetical protein